MSGASPLSVPPHRPRILVVDDERAIVRCIVRQLARAGLEVIGANDGAEAVRLLAADSFDAIVTDVLLPGMSGIELLGVIRGRGLDVPVLLISGIPSVDPAAGALRYGATDYIVKPFELSVMESKIRSAVQSHQVAKERRRAREFALIRERSGRS